MGVVDEYDCKRTCQQKIAKAHHGVRAGHCIGRCAVTEKMLARQPQVYSVVNVIVTTAFEIGMLRQAAPWQSV